MSINRRYSPNHKFWDEWGRIAPVVDYAEGMMPPLGEVPVAAWLPVQRLEREINAYFTLSVGKVVAKDLQGNCVPAGLRKAWNVAGGANVLTYTATDVAELVTDLTTGVAVTAAVTYDRDAVTAALQERGLIAAGEQAMDFITKPIGIASYNFYKNSGDSTTNPAGLLQHNFRPQALVQVTADRCATYPLVPAVETTEIMNGAFADLANSIDWSATRTGGWFGSTAINGLVKYAGSVAAGADVVCYVFEKYPVAKVTVDTPITASVAGLTHEVSTVGAIAAAGDYFFDYNLGLLFLYEAGGDAIPAPWGLAATITYYQYEDVVEANRVSTFACATGPIKQGDFLTYDANSNLIKAVLDVENAEGYDGSGDPFAADPDYGAGTDANISDQLEQAISNWLEGIVGQVTGTEKYPKDLLDYTRTAYAGQTAANMRTPGTATEGRTDQLTYTNASDTMLIVNLILR